MTSDQSELEVLTMTAEARAGHTSVVASTLLSLATLAIAALVFISIYFGREFAPGGLKALFLLFGGLLACNFIFGWFAWGRLNNALRPKRDHAGPPRFAEPGYVPASPDSIGLPPARESFISVTDGTTELLEPRSRENEPLHAESRRTFSE